MTEGAFAHLQEAIGPSALPMMPQNAVQRIRQTRLYFVVHVEGKPLPHRNYPFCWFPEDYGRWHCVMSRKDRALTGNTQGAAEDMFPSARWARPHTAVAHREEL
ncbi:hypothetical protein VZT92_003345 [Zoarces viviparus]|uniref:Uncharacterized protein n=1 Tax=Zoarces viviparus TaxID=48416 RepID=A0AAW1G274_ZOAVI